MPDQDFNIKVVTTADTAGIRQTSRELEQLRNQEAFMAEKARRESLALEAERAKAAKQKPPPVPPQYQQVDANLGRAVTYGLAGGLALVTTVQKALNELVKVNQEISKDLDGLTQMSKKWADIAKSASSLEDTAQIARTVGASIDDARKKMNDFQNQGKSFNEEFAMTIAQFVDRTGLLPGLLNKVMEKQHKDEQDRLSQDFEKRREIGLRTVQDAKAYADEINNLKAAPYLETVEKLQRQIAEDIQLADNNLKGGYIDSYAKNIEQSEKHKNQLKQITQHHQEARGELEKTAPQVQAIIANEQAAAKARSEGREKDADLYQKAADDFRKAATPEQLVEANRIMRELGIKGAPKTVDEWRKQQEKATQDFNDAQKLAMAEFADPELKQLNAELRARGQKPMTEAQKGNLEIKTAVEELGLKFDKYWGP